MGTAQRGDSGESRRAVSQPDPTGSLRDRGPAHDSMLDFLAHHRRRRPRTAIDRFFGRTVLDSAGRDAFHHARAEIIVGEQLDGFESGWVVLHALPIGPAGATIDHLVIGPGGVFAVRAEQHRDALVDISPTGVVSTRSRPSLLRRVEWAVGLVERSLTDAVGFPVRAGGIIAVLDPAAPVRAAGHSAQDVRVIESAELTDWLCDLDPILPAETVATLIRAASLDQTWGADGRIAPDHVASRRIRAEFDDVVHAVRSSERTRRLWFVVAVTPVFGMAGIAAWGISLFSGGLAGGAP